MIDLPGFVTFAQQNGSPAVIGAKGTFVTPGTPPADLQIYMTAPHTEAEYQNAKALALVYSWPAPPPQHNPAQLVSQITAAIHAGNLPLLVIQHLPFLLSLNATDRKILYGHFKSPPPAGMTTAMFTLLETLAANAGVPLV